jgi:hypothetical protein
VDFQPLLERDLPQCLIDRLWQVQAGVDDGRRRRLFSALAAAGVSLWRDRRVTTHLARTVLLHSYTIIMLYCYNAIIGLSRVELTSGQDRTG